jgi:hypothetical protein
LRWLRNIGRAILGRPPSAAPIPGAAPGADVDLNDARSRYAVRLALTYQIWVNRRTEIFVFVDADTVRRRMTVDFDTPPGESLRQGDTVYVPVMLLDKENLRHFDITDEEGRSLPVLTAHQNGAVASRGLIVLLSSLLQEDEDLEDELVQRIVVGKPEEARHEADIALADDGALGRLVARHRRAQQLKALIEQLATSFMLLVPLPYSPGQRRLVKFAYDAAHRPGTGITGWRRAYSLWNRTVSSFGWAARVEDFDELLVGFSGSYHAEIVPPADTYVREASLTVVRGGGRIEKPERDEHSYRPHLYTRSEGRGDQGRLALKIQAVRGGLVLPLFVSACVLAGGLAFVPDRIGALDNQTLAAILLVPFALAAFYIRPVENTYVTRMLRGVRLLAAVPVLAGVLVITMLALGYLDPNEGPIDQTAVSVATWAARCALWSAVGLGFALASPTLGRTATPAVRQIDAIENDLLRLTLGVLAVLAAVGLILALVGVSLYGLHRILPI